jgi:hypothetical protein
MLGVLGQILGLLGRIFWRGRVMSTDGVLAIDR